MNVFKDLRKKKGLTQVELANMLNVQQTTVSKWEVGRATPDYPVLIKLSELYSVSVDYLLGVQSQSGGGELPLSPLEWEIIKKYRALPSGSKSLVLKMLDIPEGEGRESKRGDIS